MLKRAIKEIKKHLLGNIRTKKPSPVTQSAKIVIHLEVVEDSFSWLKSNDKQVHKYIAEENRYASRYLLKHHNFIRSVVQKLGKWTKLENDSYGYEINGMYEYFYKEDGNLYRRKIHSESSEELVINRNSESGKFIYNIGAVKISPCENYVAYLADTTARGSFDCIIKNIQDGDAINCMSEVSAIACPYLGTFHYGYQPIFQKQFVQDTVLRVCPNQPLDMALASSEWMSSEVLCYTKKEVKANRVAEIYSYSVINGTKTLLYDEKDESYSLHLTKSRSGNYIFFNVASKNTSEVIALNCENGNRYTIWSRTHCVKSFIDHCNHWFYSLTEDQNGEYCLKTMPESRCQLTPSWEVLYGKGGPQNFITDVDFFNQYIVVIETHELVPEIKLLALNGDVAMVIKPFKTPGVVEIDRIKTMCDRIHFTFTSPIQPPLGYSCNIGGEVEESEEVFHFSNDKFCYSQEYAQSSGGEKIPISVFHEENIALQSSPMLCHVYGSYGLPINMSFNHLDAYLLKHGWIVAYLHVRGGGECGNKWYHSGRLRKKENTFEDVEMCLKHLYSHGYSTNLRTALMGRSAGGLPIAVLLNRKPDMISSAVLQVPFINVLSTMLDKESPLVTQEVLEFGNPRSKKDDFDYIRNYCPYLNMKTINKPVFLTISLDDDRVPYYIPLQWLAKQRKMQEANRCENSRIIAKIHDRGGHFGYAPGESIKQDAEIIAFLYDSLKVEQ